MTGSAVEPSGAEPVPHTDELVQLAIKAATAYGRPDLVPRLEAAAQRLVEPDIAVVVFGEFKQGKSTLINALLNTTVCPVDDDIATAVPVLVRHRDEPHASAMLARATDDDGVGLEPEPSVEVALDEIARFATDRGDRSDRVEGVEVGIPRRLLADGLVLVDTPGVGGLRSQHGEASLAMLATASAALFVSDASQELTASELDVLRRAHERRPDIALVLTKTDLHPAWRAILELDRTHLANAGLDLPILPVASPLRTLAVATNDSAMNIESGFPDLLAHLRADVIDCGRDRVIAGATREVLHVVEQLSATFEAEQAALDDPDRRAALLAELEAAEQLAQRLASGNARWQVTLNDGISDLGADIDHDLRTRLRDLNAATAARIDGADPAKHWDEIQPWLRQQVGEQVAANQVLLRDRSEALARRVAELFLQEQGDLAGLGGTHRTDELLNGLSSTTDLDVDAQGLLGAGLSVLRGSYGGMAMFGMIGGLFGMTLLLPVTLGLGLVMGGRSLGEERKRQLAQRRQQAKSVARGFVDEVNLKVAKDSRDAVRTIHRDLRDGWATRAAELVQGAQTSLHAARRAAQLGTEQADERRRDIDAELRRLRALHSRASATLGQVSA